MIERFFGPFYCGIFLAPLQHQSAAMFAFVFLQFATEPASLPAAGIGNVVQQLANGVDVTLSSPVSNISNGQVTFGEGSVVECDNIVVATDGSTATRLVGASRFGKDVVDKWDVLKVYKIDHALCAQEPPLFSQEAQLCAGLFVCGDHRNSPTVNGALVSGREATNQVLGCEKRRNQAATR